MQPPPPDAETQARSAIQPVSPRRAIDSRVDSGDVAFALPLGVQPRHATAARAAEVVAKPLREIRRVVLAMHDFAAPIAGESALQAGRLALSPGRTVHSLPGGRGITGDRIVLQAFDAIGGRTLTERVDVAAAAP